MRTLVAPSFLGIGDHSDWNKLYVKLARWANRVNGLRADAMHVDFSGEDDFIPGNHDVRIFRMITNLTRLPIEFHLMTHWPLRYASMVNDYFPARGRGKPTIIVHYEADDYHPSIFQLIWGFGFSAGLAINPATQLQTIGTDLLSSLQLITVMMVEPGQSGQGMLTEQLDKVRMLSALKRQHAYGFRIEVDGGINEHTAQLAVNAGAEILVSGSLLQQDPVKIKILQKLKREF